MNAEKDLFCVDNSKQCPINKIVVQISEIAPNDFNYKKVKRDEQYWFFTNEDINGNLYNGFFADTDIDKYYKAYQNVIDTDSIYNFIQNNPYTYEGKYSFKSESQLKEYGKARLHLGEDKDMTSLTELEAKQSYYVSKTKIYTEKVLKEMNSEVKSFQGVLLGFGIAAFASFAGTGIIFIPLYSSVCGCGYSCGSKEGFFKKMYPMKNVIVFYLTFSPAILLSIFSFFIVISKKSKYKSYYDMQFIDEYKCKNPTDTDNCTFLKHESSIIRQYVCLLIQIIILIIYPLVLSLVYGCWPKEEEPTPKIEVDMINIDKKLDKKEEETSGFSSSDFSGGFSSTAQGGGAPYNPPSNGTTQPNPDFAPYNQGYNPGYNQG